MPGIAGRQNVIERRADRLLRVRVRRRIVDARAQLVFGMVGAHRDVIRSRLFQDARRELVAGQRLHFVRQRDRVLALEILFELAAFTR